MYRYEKKHKISRKGISVILGCLVIASASYLTLQMDLDEPSKPVFKEDLPVLNLPSSNTEEIGVNPFLVKASLVMDYFKGEESEVATFTKFEDTYRASQGVDYSFEDQNFDVLSMFSGKIIEVKEDPIFGESVCIESGPLRITYQSLQDIKVKVNDEIKQGAIFAKAGKNSYNKDLSNHLHVVVTNNGILCDPKGIIDQKISALK